MINHSVQSQRETKGKHGDHEEQKAIYVDNGGGDPKDSNPKAKQDDNSDQAIKDVWLSNFFSAMENISCLVDEYNYVAMVSKFDST